MRFVQALLATLSLSLGLVAASALASPSNPKNGAEYLTLDKAQQTESGKKVEVTEFFWYSCPHCNALEPTLEEWVKKQGNNIVFKRVPIAFDPRFLPQQKLYYTLEAMGKVDEQHQKVFNAIHVQRQRLDTDVAIADFAVKQGLDKAKFVALYNSFGVQTKAARATQLQNAYKVDGVPMLAVDGRFVTSPSIVGAALGGQQPEPVLFSSTLQVLDALIVKVAAEKGQDVASAKKK